MLRTDTPLWRIAFLSGFGIMPSGCGAKAESAVLASGSGIPTPRGVSGTPDVPSTQSMPGTPCIDSVPLIEGELGATSEEATGLELCKDSRIHRPAAARCTSQLPRAQEPARSPEISSCRADSECTEKPLGFCGPDPTTPFGQNHSCRYGCVEDADCGAGFLCQCADPVGMCQPANCQTNADCGTELLCARGARGKYYGCETSYEFFCETPQDECRIDEDCPETEFGSYCAATDGARVCAAYSGGICGRPFLVEGSARLARLERSGDWRMAADSPECGALRAIERTELARAWSELGLMEHASIAAFARFTLQLLSVGAPAELVEQSQQALADELLHARLCFSLASEYAGEALGPGPLPTDHALDLIALEDIVALTLHEGCVGETIAALEASEALAVATDPAVRQVLARIAADERRHAELAWRFVSWAHGVGGPRVQRRIEREVAQLVAKASPPRPAVEQSFDGAAHGILPARHRAALRDAALRDVVLPCAEALLPAARPAQSDGGKPAFA